MRKEAQEGRMSYKEAVARQLDRVAALGTEHGEVSRPYENALTLLAEMVRLPRTATLAECAEKVHALDYAL